jgi:hypothetical protein
MERRIAYPSMHVVKVICHPKQIEELGTHESRARLSPLEKETDFRTCRIGPEIGDRSSLMKIELSVSVTTSSLAWYFYVVMHFRTAWSSDPAVLMERGGWHQEQRSWGYCQGDPLP